MKLFPHPLLSKFSRNHRVAVFALTLLLVLLVGAVLATSGARASGKPLRVYAAEQAAELMTRYATTRARLATYLAALTVTNDSQNLRAGRIENKGTMTARNSATGASNGEPFPGAAFACPTSFTVNNLGDAVDATPGDQICATSGGVCTLRAAIQEANAIPACTPLTINFSVNGTVLLGSPLPAIDHPNLTLNGNGATNTIISGNDAVTVLSVMTANRTLALRSLTITKGNTTGDGGGINFASSGGTLTLNNCVVTDNTANVGGGLYLGGGSTTSVTLTDTTISDNDAYISGGIQQSFSGTLTLNDCTVSGNMGTGILQSSGTLEVNRSQFINNSANPSLSAAAGAVGNTTAAVTNITDSTFTGNTSPGYGAIRSDGKLSLKNCTISNNTSTDSGAGGVAVTNGTATIINSTISGNTNNNLVVFNASVLDLTNTIVANVVSGAQCQRTNTSVINAQHNLIEGGLGCVNGTNTNNLTSDPLLAALGNYGGPTQTHALLPGSPAINAGTSTGAPTNDQRGIARVGNVDIGSYESRGFTLAINGGDNQSATINTAFANPLSVMVSSSNSEPVQGGQVTFTPPSMGESATIAGNPATISSSGVATTGTVTANAFPGGPYNVTASANGASPSLSFNLTNTAPSADLAITKTDGVISATPGGSVTYTITASNAGPSNASGATVVDTFPAAISSASWTCVGAGGGNCTSGPVSGNINDTVNLPAGASVTYTVTANIAASATGSLSNMATVTVPGGMTDSNPNNNKATDTDTLIPSANLSVTNVDTPDPVQAGNNLTYTITVNNAGPSNASSVSLSAPLPTGTTFVALTAPGDWSCTTPAVGSAGIVNCTNTSLGVGSAVFTLVVNVGSSVAGGTMLNNLPTVSSSTTDPTPGNEIAEAETTVVACPSLFTVNDLGDAGDATPGDYLCATAGGVCTLRAAIQEANAITACTPLTINFSVTGTITHGSALPAIAHPNLTITGPGASSLTVSGNNLYRVMSIASGSYNVSISGLTLANGYIKGADTTAVSGTNFAVTESGAGLYSLSSGMVNVTDCVITNNTAQGGNATGGTNAYGGDGQGAGIYLQGSTAKLTRCTISNNSALGGLGMGGTTQTLDGTGKGAGVFKHSGSLTVEDCTIADNIVDRIAGSVLSGFTQAQGGGLYNNSGALAVTGSTFSGNRRPNTLTLAGAAIANQANNITWTLTNCTFSGNIGHVTIAHIPTNGTLTMVNCTVANNTLSTGNSSAGAIFNQGSGPNLSTLNLKNTILGNNADGPNVRKNGTVISQGNNFDSDSTTGFTDGVNGDIVGTTMVKKDPKLSALGNYGGLTKTQVPLPGSQLLDAGTATGAPATDQRGIARPQGSGIDIGAVEAQTFTLALVGGTPQSTTVNTAFPTALQVNLKEGTNNIQGAPISYVGPGTVGVASINPTSGTATTDASGNASYTATANTIAGGYNVSASIGTLVQQFALTNNPGAATNFLVSAPPSATLGSAFSFTVTARDAFNNTATGYSGTVQFTSSDAVASLPVNSTLTSGTGMFSATLNTINNQTITATDTVTSSITGTSNNILVSLNTCPMTFTVNDLGDTTDANLGNGVCADASGKCTLRAALQEANALVSPVLCSPLTINITATGTILLGNDLPTIMHPNLTINGPGANQLTVSGASMYRPFNIGSGNYAVTISGLTVANGRGNGGGGLLNQSTGIVNLDNLTFDSNAITASSGGGGVRHASIGTLNITGSTFVNNNSTGTGGGGINNFSTGTVNVTNSTFSGNLANLGGGIHTQAAGITNITNCTLVSNGGGIRNNTGTVTVKNTIAVGNGTDIDGTVTSTNNLTGTLAAALLSALGNHGGTTQTFALLPGSPAINAGTNSGAPATDQRGITRPQQTTVDIGAFESRGFSMIVNGGNNQSTNVNTLFASPLSVQITSSNGEPVNGGQVTFTPPGMGESATIAGNPATISSGVATTGNVTANGTVGGPYTVAAAANGVATGVNFSLTNTNPAPTIMAGSALSRQQGAAASNSTIATVNDANQSAGTLSVTPVTVPTGIVITNILNTNGTITADVEANCLAKLGPNTVTLQVSDAFGAMAAMPASLTVNVMAAPLPTLSIDDVTVVEGNSSTVSAIFTVTLTGVLNYCPTVTVNYATADDTATLGDNDYQNTFGTVTFNSPYGNNVVTHTITVPVVGDADFEGTERFFLNLSSPSNATIQKGQGIGTITDDDLQPADIKAQIGDPALCLTAGGLVGITATVTNPNAVAVNADFKATLPASLNGLPGTGLASINPAGITVTNSMVTWMGTIPANTTLIISYKAQIVPGTPPGQPICVTSDVVFNNGPAAQIQECTVLNCPANGVVKVSDQKPGSLLVFPYYTSKAAEKKDTRMTISNVSNQPVTAHVFFIDGATCQQADQFLCLSPYASFAFKSSEYDPEATGWLLVVAVDAMGRPVQANSLIGNAFVVDGEYVDNYGAEAFRANSPLLATLTADTATLFFDNQSYDAVPNQFAVEVQSPLDAAQQRVITVGLQGDLTTSTITGAGQVGPGLVINGNEKPMGSFIGWLNGNCQAQTVISTTTPRVPSGMNGVIPKGQVGTLQWRIGAGVGLLLTPRNTPWSGIRTLHKTGSTATTLTIPLYRPVC